MSTWWKFTFALKLLFMAFSALCMEYDQEYVCNVEAKNNEEAFKESLLLTIFPSEIYQIILEFVLGVDPTLIKADNIFESLINAKKYILKNGNNFASTCNFFNGFKKELPKIARLNLQKYLALHPAKEYLVKDKKELSLMLASIFYEKNDKEAQLVKAAKLICAGASPDTLIKYKTWPLDFPKTLVEAQAHLLNFIIRTCEVTDRTKLLPLLFLYNVDVNFTDEKGNTALIIASKMNFPHLVKELLSRKNINVNARDAADYSALDYAQAVEYQEVVNMLLNANATKDYAKVRKLKNEYRTLPLSN